MCKKLMFIMVVIITIILVGCSLENKEDIKDEDNTSHEGENEQKPPEVEIDPIKEQIKSMSLDEKIGQMLMVGIDGYALDDNAREMISTYNVGGIILFKDNMENSQQIVELINDLKKENSKNNIPLFFSIDEEGGRVTRMPAEIKKLPSSRVIGQANDRLLSYKIGSVIAEEIKSFGFNMNFAPVLDIDSNPNNPVIGDRSFGSNEEIVSELGISTMKGMQSKEVVSVVKHFPGHGDTSVDSHIGLPTVDKDLNGLLEFELIPFIKAIENNADVIMVAHILFNNIDPNNPATLSKNIITDILRDELKFDGVVITDDMTMGAIVENYQIENAVVSTINAGSDIVLVCHGYENMVKSVNAIKNAVEYDTIKEERIDQSLYRILKLKNKYNINDQLLNNVNIDEINNNIETILKLINEK